MNKIFDNVLLDLFINGDLSTRIVGLSQSDKKHLIHRTLAMNCKRNPKNIEEFKNLNEQEIETHVKNYMKSKPEIF